VISSFDNILRSWSIYFRY